MTSVRVGGHGPGILSRDPANRVDVAYRDDHSTNNARLLVLTWPAPTVPATVTSAPAFTYRTGPICPGNAFAAAQRPIVQAAVVIVRAAVAIVQPAVGDRPGRDPPVSR